MGPIILTSKLFGFGGIERFGRQITKAVADHATEKSQQVTVFTLVDEANEIQANYFDRNVNLNCFGGNRFLFIIKSAFQILFYPTVVFTFHLHIAPIVYLVKLLRPKLKYGVHIHGIEAWFSLSGLRKKALQEADFITSSSKFTAEKAAEMNQLDPERISVLYPALDDEWLEKMLPVPVESDQDMEINNSMLLTVARLTASDKRKGIDLVIQALPELIAEFPDLEYVIVGSGDDLPRLKSLAADLNIHDRVHFKGGISDKELIQFYQTCSLFIMPSSTEGLGIVYLEAMAFSKPVISGAYGGSSEVVIPGESGYLIPYNDIPAIQKAVSKILADSDKASKMGQRGNLLLQEKFNQDNMASNIIALLWPPV